MCWKCDAIAVTCPSVTLLYQAGCTSPSGVGAPPPHQTPSDGSPPLEPQTTAFFTDDFAQSGEQKKRSRQAAGGLNLTAKTGTSGPKPEIPGAMAFSDFFCL